MGEGQPLKASLWGAGRGLGWAGVTWDHLEAQDDGPDQPQGQSVVPIHDVM